MTTTRGRYLPSEDYMHLKHIAVVSGLIASLGALAIALVPSARGGGLDTGIVGDTGFSTESLLLDGYICNLTDAQIDNVISYYSFPTTRTAIAPYVTAPFDCSLVGDTCEMMGAVRAEQWSCNLWNRLRNHDSLASIETAMVSDFEAKQAAREVQLFPNGIPSDDAWWGGVHYLAEVCYVTTTDATDSVESGSDRVWGKSYYTNLGLYVQIGSYVKGYYKSGATWHIDTTATVSGNTDFWSSNGGGTCAGPAGGSPGSDSDGVLHQYEKGWIGSYTYEGVATCGSMGSVGYTTTGRIATWNDC